MLLRHKIPGHREERPVRQSGGGWSLKQPRHAASDPGQAGGPGGEKMQQDPRQKVPTQLGQRSTGEPGPELQLGPESLQKHNKSFHKLFPEIPENEMVTHACSCSLQREVLYHGRLFLSENYLCFHSSVLLKDTKVPDSSPGFSGEAQRGITSVHASHRW
ncbi:unnamed protein product [Tetraodon nigroviridis]|uniref:(spotted green pufferfish) hypothetical protein n=1 Tax=Tetraodon nigroviridis TaxID=99883 RepID=Q4RV20_TETNG|nr:unnamed protein product [Tetraodon nigroviridis]